MCLYQERKKEETQKDKKKETAEEIVQKKEVCIGLDWFNRWKENIKLNG